MADGSEFSAQLLRASGEGLAGLATSRLFETTPEFAERYAPDGFESWRSQYRIHLDYLATAVEDGLPETFARHLAWQRTAFQSRQVSPEDLRLAVTTLRHVIESELPPPAVAPLAPCFDAAIDSLAGAIHTEQSTLSGPHAALISEILSDLLAGHARQCRERIVGALAQVEARELATQVLVPALHEVGHLWHIGEIGVAEEHFATGVIRRTMARVLEDATPAPANGKTVLIGAVAGDGHDVAVQLIASLFELDGWRAIDLGADIPSTDMVLAAQRFHGDLVVVSATLEVQRQTASELIGALRSTLPNMPVLVGGSAFHDGESWRTTGADAYTASATSAVERGRSLCGLD